MLLYEVLISPLTFPALLSIAEYGRILYCTRLEGGTGYSGSRELWAGSLRCLNLLSP